MIALVLGAWMATAQTPPARPNVIVVVWDATRPDHLGPYGYERDTTPNLSAWATSAAVFERAQTSAPWSAPATAGLFTGLFTQNHTVDGKPGEAAYSVRPSLTTLAEAMHDAGYATGLFTAQGSYINIEGMKQGFDEFAFVGDEVLLNNAIAFQGRIADRPTFTVLHWQDPHPPYTPSATHALWSDPTQPQVMLGNRKEEGWHRPDRVNNGTDPLSPAQMAQLTAQYDGELHANDARFGELLAYVNEHGGAANTIIAFTATHGEGLGEHPRQMVWHDVAYDTILNVPLIVSGPGVTATRVPTRVRNIDLYPTLLDLIGQKPTQPINGESLLPLLAGGGKDRVNTGSSRYVGGMVFYSDAHTKLFFSREGAPRVELYDRDNDPFEMDNLAGDNKRLQAAQVDYEAAIKSTTLYLPQ